MIVADADQVMGDGVERSQDVMTTASGSGSDEQTRETPKKSQKRRKDKVGGIDSILRWI